MATVSARSEEGLSCYCHIGSYQSSAKTLVDSVREDLNLIDRFIGVDAVAVTDRRGQP